MTIARKTAIAAVIFALLLGSALVSQLMESLREKNTRGLFFADLDTASIETVTIADSSSSVTLVKNGSGWQVQSASGGTYQADEIKVQAALDKIAIMQKDQLVSENKENFSPLGVTDSLGMSVAFKTKDSKNESRFIIGKKSENWRYSNIRLDGDSKVYLVSGSIRFAFTTDIQEWRERSIFNHPADSVVKVNLADGSVIEKVQTVGSVSWVAQRGALKTEANVQNVSNYLQSLSNFEASGWAAEGITDAQWQSSEPPMSVSLTLADGTVETLTLGKQEPETGRFYIKNSAVASPYLIVPSAVQIPFYNFEYMIAAQTASTSASQSGQ